MAANGASEVDRIIAVGGDGTLNEVLTGLLASGLPEEERPALGFLPAGTANAAIRAFGFTTSPEAMAAALPEAQVRRVDVGVAEIRGEERPFLLWCGAGYDAVVIDYLNTSRTTHLGLSGLLRSGPGIVQALAGYPAPRIRVELDGEVTGDAMTVIMANVAQVAFGGTVVGSADPFDGRMDVVALPSCSRLGLVPLGLRMLGPGLDTVPGARHTLNTRVRLEADGPVPVQIDGEPVGELPVTVRVEAGAVGLLMT
jgi:diacylglycerol kinase family enzyme